MENRQAEWILVSERSVYCQDLKTTFELTEETCSVCRERTRFIGNKLYLNDRYCPACGTKMTGGKE